MKKSIILLALFAASSQAADLSVGYAVSGDRDGFSIQLGSDNLLGGFAFTTQDGTTDKGAHYTLDRTDIAIGYKVTLVDTLEVYPLIGGGFFTYHDNKGKSYSETSFVYGGGVRYTFDSSIIADYSININDTDSTHMLSVGYKF
tara:strand:+ start:4761 stop:5192 length:432 start_codon:yes stop_codon:yes gene_type:complete